MEENTPKFLPGFEPEEIKPLVDSFFSVINKKFPDKVILNNEWNHQAWDNATNMLCKKLGYPNEKDLLEAYGFSIVDDKQVSKTQDLGNISSAAIKHCLSCGSLIGIECNTCSRCGGKEFESYEEYILNRKKDVIVNQNAKKVKSNPSANTEKKQNQGNSSFLIIAVVLVCIFFAFPRSSNRGNGNSSNTSQVNFSNTFTEIDYKDDSWSFAVVAAKDLVKEKLKSPSTAKFPKSSEYIVKKRGNDYIVLGYVDAQNGFGATIRTNWKATFTLGDTSGKQFEISNYEVTLYE